MTLGIEVLGFKDYVIEGAMTNKKEIQMAARDVLSRWQKEQNRPREAYIKLHALLKENGMNQLALLLEGGLRGCRMMA